RHAINKDLEVFLIAAVPGLGGDMGQQRGRHDQESALAADQLATRASENFNQVCQGQTFSGGERVRICLSSPCRVKLGNRNLQRVGERRISLKTKSLNSLKSQINKQHGR